MSKLKLCRDCGDDLETASDKKRGVCSTCQCIRTSMWQKNNKEKVALKARRHKLKTYGITESIYESMLIKQGKTCKICGKINKNNKKLTIDHCHKTGVVRGLLCVKCNSALGLVDENLDVLSRLMRYVQNKGDIWLV